MKNRHLMPIAVCAVTAVAMSACSASVNNNAETTGAEPANIQIDDGGCTKNHDQIASIQQGLAKNLYGIAADNSGKGTNTNPNPKPEGEPVTITFSVEGLSHPFLVKQKEEAEAAARRHGLQINVVSANDDVNQQFNDIQTAIAQGTDALMMMPATTQGLDAVLAQAQAKQIPYFFTQKGMLGVDPVSQVLAPYSNEGKQLGEWVAEHYKDKESVNVAVISGIPGDQSSDARVNSFLLPLLRSCKFTVVANQPGNYRRGDSEKAAQNMLAANPDIDLLFGANDEAALGGIAALSSSGRTGVDVVGLDGEADMFTAIRNGQALATVIHKPTAGIVVDEIAEYMRGNPVPDFKVLSEDLVTRESIESGASQPAF